MNMATRAPAPLRPTYPGSGRPLQQRARCAWCGQGFRPRRGTGGTPQRFCAAACRNDFHGATRRWAEARLAAGELTIEEIKAFERQQHR